MSSVKSLKGAVLFPPLWHTCFLIECVFSSVCVCVAAGCVAAVSFWVVHSLLHLPAPLSVMWSCGIVWLAAGGAGEEEKLELLARGRVWATEEVKRRWGFEGKGMSNKRCKGCKQQCQILKGNWKITMIQARLQAGKLKRHGSYANAVRYLYLKPSSWSDHIFTLLKDTTVFFLHFLVKQISLPVLSITKSKKTRASPRHVQHWREEHNYLKIITPHISQMKMTKTPASLRFLSSFFSLNVCNRQTKVHAQYAKVKTTQIQ